MCSCCPTLDKNTMNRWFTIILLIGCCAAVAGQRTYYISYNKNEEPIHRIYLKGDTFGLEIERRGLIPPIVSERRIYRISDDLFSITENVPDSSQGNGIQIDYISEYDFDGKTFRQEDSQIIDTTNGRPYVNEDTINSILGDYPLLFIYYGKQISRQKADSIRNQEGEKLRYSMLSGEDAYTAFGPAGIKGAIRIESSTEHKTIAGD